MGNIDVVLEIIREIAERADFIIAERQENTDTFQKLNYAPPYLEDAAEVLKKLTAVDYKKGPEEDKGGFPGEVYVFNKKTDGKDVYIKVRILEEDGMAYMTVISFHF